MRGQTISAGELDQKISFRSVTLSENGFGEPANFASGTLAKARASVNYGKAIERRSAGIEGSILAATFRVRKNAITAAYTVKDLIIFSGAIWDISGIVPFGNVGLDFTAIKRFK
jgi:head-tail adaptor